MCLRGKQEDENQRWRREDGRREQSDAVAGLGNGRAPEAMECRQLLNQWFSTRGNLAPGVHLQCLKMFFIVTAGGGVALVAFTLVDRGQGCC